MADDLLTVVESGKAQAPPPDPTRVRIARALASPVGVLVTLPLLVIAVGVGILLVGRSATTTAAHSLARGQLVEQASAVQHQVAYALDQAAPLLARLRVIADPERPVDDVLVRLHDLVIARPGIAYASLSFPDGTFRGAYRAGAAIEVHESTATQGSDRRFTVVGGMLQPLRTHATKYDPRERAFYQQAVAAGARVWTSPYAFFRSHETGISCAEPLLAADGSLQAVLTVDFDVGALSSYVAKPGLGGARSVMFTGDGVILAYPSVPPTTKEDRVLRADDFGDPALVALLATARSSSQSFAELSAQGARYLVSTAPIGGTRAGVAAPLDWYVATIVPAQTLLGGSETLVRTSVIASAGALLLATGLALVFAWNLLRMRRLVAESRAQAATARARAKELGSYRLVAKLGTGGMGEVWRAEHRLLARSAAIKLIRSEVLAQNEGLAEVKERFRREAQTLASLRSRHTTEIFDYGVANDGTFYYVMELLEGLDFERLVAKDGPQPAGRVIDLLLQACQSLAEAHDAGLLHRDIKPPNLFTCRAADEVDIVKLLDFGIVMARDELTGPSPLAAPLDAEPPIAGTPKLTQMGAMVGTPGFMPPEQILGMKLDGRADLYALGCVAWWLLTGKELFARDGVEARLLRLHVAEPPPPLCDKVKGWCPPELEAVLHACLAKEADDRPRDARDLAAMLRAIPIPEEELWTEARAQAWWNSYVPAAPVRFSASNVQMLVLPTDDK